MMPGCRMRSALLCLVLLAGCCAPDRVVVVGDPMQAAEVLPDGRVAVPAARWERVIRRCSACVDELKACRSAPPR